MQKHCSRKKYLFELRESLNLSFSFPLVQRTKAEIKMHWKHIFFPSYHGKQDLLKKLYIRGKQNLTWEFSPPRKTQQVSVKLQHSEHVLIATICLMKQV